MSWLSSVSRGHLPLLLKMLGGASFYFLKNLMFHRMVLLGGSSYEGVEAAFLPQLPLVPSNRMESSPPKVEDDSKMPPPSGGAPFDGGAPPGAAAVSKPAFVTQALERLQSPHLWTDSIFPFLPVAVPISNGVCCTGSPTCSLPAPDLVDADAAGTDTKILKAACDDLTYELMKADGLAGHNREVRLYCAKAFYLQVLSPLSSTSSGQHQDKIITKNSTLGVDGALAVLADADIVVLEKMKFVDNYKSLVERYSRYFLEVGAVLGGSSRRCSVSVDALFAIMHALDMVHKHIADGLHLSSPLGEGDSHARDYPLSKAYSANVLWKAEEIMRINKASKGQGLGLSEGDEEESLRKLQQLQESAGVEDAKEGSKALGRILFRGKHPQGRNDKPEEAVRDLQETRHTRKLVGEMLEKDSAHLAKAWEWLTKHIPTAVVKEARLPVVHLLGGPTRYAENIVMIGRDSHQAIAERERVGRDNFVEYPWRDPHKQTWAQTLVYLYKAWWKEIEQQCIRNDVISGGGEQEEDHPEHLHGDPLQTRDIDMLKTRLKQLRTLRRARDWLLKFSNLDSLWRSDPPREGSSQSHQISQRTYSYDRMFPRLHARLQRVAEWMQFWREQLEAETDDKKRPFLVEKKPLKEELLPRNKSVLAQELVSDEKLYSLAFASTRGEIMWDEDGGSVTTLSMPKLHSQEEEQERLFGGPTRDHDNLQNARVFTAEVFKSSLDFWKEFFSSKTTKSAEGGIDEKEIYAVQKDFDFGYSDREAAKLALKTAIRLSFPPKNTFPAFFRTPHNLFHEKIQKKELHDFSESFQLRASCWARFFYQELGYRKDDLGSRVFAALEKQTFWSKGLVKKEDGDKGSLHYVANLQDYNPLLGHLRLINRATTEGTRSMEKWTIFLGEQMKDHPQLRRFLVKKDAEEFFRSALSRTSTTTTSSRSRFDGFAYDYNYKLEEEVLSDVQDNEGGDQHHDVPAEQQEGHQAQLGHPDQQVVEGHQEEQQEGQQAGTASSVPSFHLGPIFGPILIKTTAGGGSWYYGSSLGGEAYTDGKRFTRWKLWMRHFVHDRKIDVVEAWMMAGIYSSASGGDGHRTLFPCIGLTGQSKSDEEQLASTRGGGQQLLHVGQDAPGFCQRREEVPGKRHAAEEQEISDISYALPMYFEIWNFWKVHLLKQNPHLLVHLSARNPTDESSDSEEEEIQDDNKSMPMRSNLEDVASSSSSRAPTTTTSTTTTYADIVAMTTKELLERNVTQEIAEKQIHFDKGEAYRTILALRGLLQDAVDYDNVNAIAANFARMRWT
ncbi:unnamed protein product [Amoebophrya sp. A25]|nr:unnamed protein product [Amoebophrya sp. A25]|eukprot:GSA25T00024129001.1